MTHDRYFLDNVAGWILELDRGHGIPWEGNYSSWLEQKQNRLAQEEKAESKRQRTLQRELDWIRMSPRARQAKGKARLNAYEELLNQDQAQKIDSVEIYIPPGPRLGDVVVEARNVRKAYGDVLLMDDINFTLPRGGIVGVIGPNGAGKTTLFRMITGQETTGRRGRSASARRCRSATSTSRATRSTPNKSVWEEITGGLDEVELGKRSVPRRAYVLVVQLQGRQPAAEGRSAVGRRAQPRAPGQAAQDAAATCCCWTSRPTTSTSTRCARWKTRCSTSPAAPWSSATTGGSWIASRRTCWRSRATARWCGSRATTRTTRRTGKRRLGAEADRPHRIKYRKLTR